MIDYARELAEADGVEVAWTASDMRSFTLPEDADGSKVSAEYKDGVLKVRLPKSEKAKPKSIEVKVS